ncbi:DNA polymerase, partial [Fervidobacterium sp. SC_NGM5_G05]
STQADILRKAIAKKDIDSIRQLYERLKNALFGKLGKEGLELAKNILAFGEYAFNKSHAIAYSHLTYYMAYFKVNFPDIFYDTYLKYDTSILQDALYNLQTLNYKVLPPKLFSNLKTMNKDEKIYHLPLHILPGISVEKSKQLQTMEFKSFEDFVEKADLPLSVIEALIKVGAFDDIFESRRKAIQKLRNLRNKFNQEAVKIGNKLFGKIVKVDETKVEEDWERTNMEYDILGIAVSLPTKVTNNLAPYCIAYSLDLPYAVHVSVKAGYGTDGKSVFKVNLPDGNYTLVYPNRFEPGHMKVSYEVKTIPTRAEISKLSTQGFEQIILPSGKVLQNSRPIMNGIRTVLRDK